MESLAGMLLGVSSLWSRVGAGLPNRWVAVKANKSFDKASKLNNEELVAQIRQVLSPFTREPIKTLIHP